MLSGLGLSLLTRAFYSASPPHLLLICALHSSTSRAGRVGPYLVYKLTVVSLYWENICSWHVRESVLAFRTVVSGSNFKNKEYSDFGFLPKCVWSLHSKTRVVRFTFCFH